MELNRSTLIIIAITLVVGVGIGGFVFNGSSQAEALSGHEDHEHTMDENGLWTCSMHPQVRQSEPGSCPFCGMDLIPVSNNEDEDPRVLKMSNEAIRLANIQTTIIKEGASNSSLRLNGKVRADERRMNTQTTHFAGRIEKLYKNFEGDLVNAGDKIASIYSPELVAAQEELIEAKKLEKSNPVLLEAARKKLNYWKLTQKQIEAIESSEKPILNFDLLADYNGVVTKRLVNTGDHLHEGEGLLELTDLSKLWVVFEVYEKDLGLVKNGDKILFSTNSSSESYEGTVSFIDTKVDPVSRIVEIRADINNKRGLLKPDMFVNGEISHRGTNQLLVPKSAVLWTGKRSIVYLKGDEPGAFELKEVTLGQAIGQTYQVLEGLSAGDEVVTNGAFTIDAEAQLQGKTSMMSQSITVNNPETQIFQEVELPQHKDYQGQVDPKFQEQLSKFSTDYIRLKDKMVEGNGNDIRKAGIALTQSLAAIDMSLTQGEAHHHWMALLEPMQMSLTTIGSSNNRDQQRLQFINLSKALINAIRSFGTTHDSPLYIQFCPMANNDKGATWVSLEEQIINPYFGDVMLTCGNVEDIIMN